MRLEEVTVGTHKVGPFTISVQKPVFQTAPDDSLNYFEVLVHQADANVPDVIYYIDLVADERFAIFNHIKSFAHKLAEEDVVEYNAYVSTVYMGFQWPTFKLGRRSIVDVFDKCQSLAKKLKKKK